MTNNVRPLARALHSGWPAYWSARAEDYDVPADCATTVITANTVDELFRAVQLLGWKAKEAQGAQQ